MKTNLAKPLTYFILGLPRSGTTIVASVLNSLDDGICLCEPHWYMESQQKNLGEMIQACISPYKVSITDNANSTNPRDVFGNTILPLTKNYKLVGYKETWRGDELGFSLLEHLPEVDFFIIVLRHPLECHRSQMRLNWPADKWTIEKASVNSGLLIGLSYHPRCVTIDFDMFVANPIRQLNLSLYGKLQIGGDLQLKPTGWLYGDPRANQSTEVEKN